MSSVNKELEALFAELDPPQNDGDLKFTVHEVPGYERHLLGKDPLDRPALLLASDEEDVETFPIEPESSTTSAVDRVAPA